MDYFYYAKIYISNTKEVFECTSCIPRFVHIFSAIFLIG